MFGLAGLVCARAIVIKMSTEGNVCKILALFAIIHSIMEALAPEYYLLYLSTKDDFYSKFIYCFNASTFFLVTMLCNLEQNFCCRFLLKPL
jgi:hypothetical protein